MSTLKLQKTHPCIYVGDIETDNQIAVGGVSTLILQKTHPCIYVGDTETDNQVAVGGVSTLILQKTHPCIYVGDIETDNHVAVGGVSTITVWTIRGWNKPTNKCHSDKLQWNFNGSNTFGTMKMCSRQGKFELMSVNHSARPEGVIGFFFDF